MKTIGLIGGMSWHSTAEYYRIINETTEEITGGEHSAVCMIYSVDFREIERLQNAGHWPEVGGLLVNAARKLKAGGSDVILICSNTAHKLADRVESASGVPLLNIVDVTAEIIAARELKKVGLLGTRFTMEDDFFTGGLARHHNIETLVPPEDERIFIHRVIHNELCSGTLLSSTRERFKEIAEGLVDRGVRGIILGCTEIPLLIGPEDVPVPIFDTTSLHARRAVEYSLARP